jgi:hypothetical protein
MAICVVVSVLGERPIAQAMTPCGLIFDYFRTS